jgi:hypothetical protein
MSYSQRERILNKNFGAHSPMFFLTKALHYLNTSAAGLSPDVLGRSWVLMIANFSQPCGFRLPLISPIRDRMKFGGLCIMDHQDRNL